MFRKNRIKSYGRVLRSFFQRRGLSKYRIQWWRRSRNRYRGFVK